MAQRPSDPVLYLQSNMWRHTRKYPYIAGADRHQRYGDQLGERRLESRAIGPEEEQVDDIACLALRGGGLADPRPEKS